MLHGDQANLTAQVLPSMASVHSAGNALQPEVLTLLLLLTRAFDVPYIDLN